MLNFAEVKKISSNLVECATKVKKTPEDEASVKMMYSDVCRLQSLKRMCLVAYESNLFYEENGYTFDFLEECINDDIAYIKAIIKYCEGYQKALQDMKEGKAE